MKSDFDNPWVSRFAPLLDAETIRQSATVTVEPLRDLAKLPIELACKRLESALDEVFYPTRQCVNILQRLIGEAHAYSSVTYTDKKSFLGGVYAKEPPTPEFSFPICLTGLAGTGKSKLLKAFCRILGADQEVVADGHHPPFPLQSAWAVLVQVKARPNDVLRTLAGQDGKSSDLMTACRKKAFRNGVPILLADEFQFATGSSSANTLISQMLLTLGYIGPPFVYAANFSLLRRLLGRPEEEKQRLVANPIIVVPDSWDSNDWTGTLAAQIGVAPDLLRLDPVNDAQAMHRLSGGRKRIGAKLLLHTFRAAHSEGGVVNIAAIERTFQSPQFATYRVETEALIKQNIQNQPINGHEDLWCPLPLPKDAAAAFRANSTASREANVAEKELRAALTGAEREAADSIAKTLRLKPSKSAKVLKLKKSKGASGEQLLANAALFREKL